MMTKETKSKYFKYIIATNFLGIPTGAESNQREVRSVMFLYSRAQQVYFVFKFIGLFFLVDSEGGGEGGKINISISLS